MSYPVGHMGTPLERFAMKYEPVTESGCWIWTGSAGRYGKFAIVCGKPVDAHRASWVIHHGEIPAGMRVLHRCDVPLCVNPSHLFLGTARENTRDMLNKGRHRFGTWNAPAGANHWKRRKNIHAF